MLTLNQVQWSEISGGRFEEIARLADYLNFRALISVMEREYSKT